MTRWTKHRVVEKDSTEEGQARAAVSDVNGTRQNILNGRASLFDYFEYEFDNDMTGTWGH